MCTLYNNIKRFHQTYPGQAPAPSDYCIQSVLRCTRGHMVGEPLIGTQYPAAHKAGGPPIQFQGPIPIA